MAKEYACIEYGTYMSSIEFYIDNNGKMIVDANREYVFEFSREDAVAV